MHLKKGYLSAYSIYKLDSMHYMRCARARGAQILSIVLFDWDTCLKLIYRYARFVPIRARGWSQFQWIASDLISILYH